jgi:spore coat polysaccharide biosynthesis protein SpsF
MRTVALIQARMSSSRFPGKVLEPIAGVPSIAYMVNRVRRAKLVDEIAIVTSLDASDDILATTLGIFDISVYRGDLDDVLKRYFDAACYFDAAQIVRLTGDCPLIDPAVIDSVIDARLRASTDYSSNIDPPTFPDGLDCECFSLKALETTHNRAKTLSEREHVTLWMRSDQSGLSRVNFASMFNASHLRLTVDYPDDLAAVSRLISVMPDARNFDYFDLLRGLSEHPEISQINLHGRNEHLAAL